MKIIVIRYDLGVKESIGLFLVDGVFECYSLEDRDRGLTSDMNEAVIVGNKVYGETAIPTGTYKVAWTFSQRFQKWMPELLNVKGYVGIRIHGGNTDKDVLGCIATGQIAGVDSVQASQAALTKLLPKIEDACAKGDCWITVTRIKDLIGA